jgi:hypothetical protein
MQVLQDLTMSLSFSGACASAGIRLAGTTGLVSSVSGLFYGVGLGDFDGSAAGVFDQEIQTGGRGVGELLSSVARKSKKKRNQK